MFRRVKPSSALLEGAASSTRFQKCAAGRALPTRSSGATAAIAWAVALTAGAATAGHAQSQQDDPLQAQETAESDGGQLEEIVVTAAKREETLQDISASVTALSGDRLQQGQIDDLQDIQTVAPSVTFGNDFNMAKIFIRGVGANTSTTGSETGVAFHVDGAFVARAEAQLTSLFDIERVEVVRGPQGTLYGRNAVGGSINVITKKPTPEWEGYGRATIGKFSQLTVEGGVGGPITDTIRTRVAFKVNTRDGFGENPVTGSEISDRNRRMARTHISFVPNEDFDLRITGEWFRQDDASGALKFRRENFLPSQFPDGEVDPGLKATGIGGFADDPRDLASEIDANTDTETWAVTSEFNWQATDRLALTGIVNFRDFDSSITQDLDVSAVVNSLATTGNSTSVQRRDVDSEQFSSELRANFVNEWLDGVLGVFFFDEDQSPVDTVGFQPVFGQESNLDVLRDPASGTPPLLLRNGAPVIPAEPVDIQRALEICNSDGLADSIRGREVIPPKRVCINSDLGTTAWAIFGQARVSLGEFVDPLEDFTLKLGGRFSDEERTTANPTLIIGGGGTGPVLRGTPEFSANERNFDEFTPEIGLEWRPNPNLMLYYTYSEGFKAGAGENSAGAGFGSDIIVDPETIENHEAGVKASLFNGRMNVSLAGFTYDLQNLQINKTQADPTAGFITIFENAAETTAKGIEFDFDAQVVPSLRVSGAVSYLDSEFEEFITADPLDPRNIQGSSVFDPRDINLEGNRTRNSPEWAANLHLEYDLPIEGLPHDGTLIFNSDVNYKGDIFFTEFNREVEGQDEYTIFDAALRYTSGNGRVTAEFWGENLTDELVASSTFALSTARTIGVTYLPPRTFGFTVGYNF